VSDLRDSPPRSVRAATARDHRGVTTATAECQVCSADTPPALPKRRAGSSLAICSRRSTRATWAVQTTCTRARHPGKRGRQQCTRRVCAFAHRHMSARSARPTTMPLSTSPLDAFSNPIRAAIQPRAYGLKNRERTNRLLMLMQLHAKPSGRRGDVRAPDPRMPRVQQRSPSRGSACCRRRPRPALPPLTGRGWVTHLREQSQLQTALEDALGGAPLRPGADAGRRHRRSTATATRATSSGRDPAGRRNAADCAVRMCSEHCSQI